MAVVIYHDEAGVFLGSCMGLGFWSHWDPVGQDAACTFETEADARAYVASWDEPMTGVSYRPVDPDRGTYASVSACVAAGLPPWNPRA